MDAFACGNVWVFLEKSKNIINFKGVNNGGVVLWAEFVKIVNSGQRQSKR